jgi:hypothetical protein
MRTVRARMQPRVHQLNTYSALCACSLVNTVRLPPGHLSLTSILQYSPAATVWFRHFPVTGRQAGRKEAGRQAGAHARTHARKRIQMDPTAEQIVPNGEARKKDNQRVHHYTLTKKQ